MTANTGPVFTQPAQPAQPIPAPEPAAAQPIPEVAQPVPAPAPAPAPAPVLGSSVMAIWCRRFMNWLIPAQPVPAPAQPVPAPAPAPAPAPVLGPSATEILRRWFLNWLMGRNNVDLEAYVREVVRIGQERAAARAAFEAVDKRQRKELIQLLKQKRDADADASPSTLLERLENTSESNESKENM